MSKKISSPTTHVLISDEKCFTFLADLRNFSAIIPEYIHINSSDSDYCSFDLPGHSNLGMKITNLVPNSRVSMVGVGEMPSRIAFLIKISSLGSKACQIQFEINICSTPISILMIENALQAFLNKLAENFKDAIEHWKL